MLDYAPPPDISNAIAYDKQRNPPLVEIVSNMSNPLGELEKKIGGSVYLAQNDNVLSDGGYGKNRPITDAFELYRAGKEAKEVNPFAKKTRKKWVQFDNALNVTKYFINDIYDPFGDGPAVRSHLQNQGKFSVGSGEYSFDYHAFKKYLDENRKKIDGVALLREGFILLGSKGTIIQVPISKDFVKFYDSL
jgi:hypothetical protein